MIWRVSAGVVEKSEIIDGTAGKQATRLSHLDPSGATLKRLFVNSQSA